MKNWEYQTVFGTARDNELNEFGKEGWEFFGIEPPDNTMLRRYYFKRVIKEEQL